MENEMQLFFRFLFSWRIWKKNYLIRSRWTLWLFSQVWSTRYSRASSCQDPWVFHCPAVTQTPRIRCLESSWYSSMFMLLAPTFMLFYSCSQLRYKTNQQEQPSWGVLLKSFQKSFIKFLIVKVDLKFNPFMHNVAKWPNVL